MKDISIVIVNWNGKDLLLRCLESLTERVTSKDIEIIVVDNASCDGSAEAVRQSYPEVKLIRNGKNEGFARGNNIGIAVSDGKYVCLINSDVLVLKDCLENLYAFMESHPSAGISGPQVLNPDMTIQYSCRRFPSLWNNFCFAFGLARRFPNRKFFSGEQMSFFAHEKVMLVDALSGCFLMVRREAMERVGLLDEKFFIYCEDIDWCKRFRSIGWEIIFNPKAKAIHYGGASSRREPVRFSREKQRAILKYWEKHHSRVENVLIYFILFNHHFLRLLSGKILSILNPPKAPQISFRIKGNIECLRELLSIKSFSI